VACHPKPIYELEMHKNAFAAVAFSVNPTGVAYTSPSICLAGLLEGRFAAWLNLKPSLEKFGYGPGLRSGTRP